MVSLGSVIDSLLNKIKLPIKNEGMTKSQCCYPFKVKAAGPQNIYNTNQELIF